MRTVRAARGRSSLYDVGSHANGSMSTDEFFGYVEAHTPGAALAWVDGVLQRARALAAAGNPLAAPFPDKASDVESFRRTLVMSWVHSRDITTLMHALGHDRDVTGRHDIYELVEASELKRAARQDPGRHSEWFTRYIEGLRDDQQVNIGFYNPHLAADLFYWRPGADIENAAFAHRLSAHHNGTPDDPHEPLEHAVNTLHHRREQTYGVRRAECVTVQSIADDLGDQSRAMRLMRSEIGVQIAADVLPRIEQLEHAGAITPWQLVRGCG